MLLSYKTPGSHIHVKVEFGEGKDEVPLDKIAERAENINLKKRLQDKQI